jgi:hypothetical protein
MRAIPPTLKVSLSFGRSRAHDHADAPHPLALLRARRERPSNGPAEQLDELAMPQVGHGFPPGPRAPSVYHNANKIFNLRKVWGSGGTDAHGAG